MLQISIMYYCFIGQFDFTFPPMGTGKDTLDSVPSIPHDSAKSEDNVPYHDDMVAALLKRGTKLRNDMLVHSLSDSADHVSQSGFSVGDPLNSARSDTAPGKEKK